MPSTAVPIPTPTSGAPTGAVKFSASVEYKGVRFDMKKMATLLEEELYPVLLSNVNELRTKAILKIQSDPKTGRTYTWVVALRKKAWREKIDGFVLMPNGRWLPIITRAHARLGIHTASAPGQAPATDSGYLASHIPVDVSRRAFTGEVGYFARYGGFLEGGTQYMAARPAWEPALEEQEPIFKSQTEEAIRRAIWRSAGQDPDLPPKGVA